ncbi:WWC1 [Cordylochernes scorpioides]|uniref:WWC1 n=1 Tax=Cordylochernes scorpioides TaxID=51811 RepID=A0ABY6KWI0_9ARAC|nr:WWC1 [Cordylochernes scorpioides]
MRSEMSLKEHGLETLAEVRRTLADGRSYTLAEAQAIMDQLQQLHKSLSRGEKEKAQLLQSVARLREELSQRPTPSDPTVDGLTSVGSQTECSALRLGELARLRLQYDEARKEVRHIQQELADLEDDPSDDTDRERILLVKEKEQLLRELNAINTRGRSDAEVSRIQAEISALENDLGLAQELSTKTIATRYFNGTYSDIGYHMEGYCIECSHYSVP